jgi:hypothetical protein
MTTSGYQVILLDDLLKALRSLLQWLSLWIVSPTGQAALAAIDNFLVRLLTPPAA